MKLQKIRMLLGILLAFSFVLFGGNIQWSSAVIENQNEDNNEIQISSLVDMVMQIRAGIVLFEDSNPGSGINNSRLRPFLSSVEFDNNELRIVNRHIPEMVSYVISMHNSDIVKVHLNFIPLKWCESFAIHQANIKAMLLAKAILIECNSKSLSKAEVAFSRSMLLKKLAERS